MKEQTPTQNENAVIVDESSSFSLNITVIPPVTPTTTTTATEKHHRQQQQPKKRKRLNKYERRRRQSALAKRAKLDQEEEQQHQQQQQDDEKEDSKDDAIPRDDKEDSLLIPQQQQHGSNESETELLKGFESNARNDETAKDPQSVNDDDDNNNPPPEPASTASVSPSLEQLQQKLKDEQDHAAYMAEFHARPLELDRRSGAVVKKLRPRKNHTEVVKTDTCTSWDQLPLDPKIVSVLVPAAKNNDDNALPQPHTKASKKVPTRMNHYPKPTRIQERVIQTILGQQPPHKSSPKNIWIQSETGSGKTLAYFLPILQLLWNNLQTQQQQQPAKTSVDYRATLGTQCLIVCPTQELVQQTHNAMEHLLQRLCAGRLVVGSFQSQTSRAKEKARVRKGLAVVISTPGRLLDHLQTTVAFQHAVSNLQWLVLDEVDRLFDLGLAPQLKQVIELLRQHSKMSTRTTTSTTNRIPWRSILVSATVPQDVQVLVQECLSSSSSSSSPSSAAKEKANRMLLNTNTKKWAWIQGGENDYHDENGNNDNDNFSSPSQMAFNNNSSNNHQGRSLPKQLEQYHIMVSAKLRLTTLIAFLADRVAQGERTVVFMSTCASVDYYHQLLTTMDCILAAATTTTTTGKQQQQDDRTKTPNGGIFGAACSIHKLHGNVPHQQRHDVLKSFQRPTATTSNHNNSNETTTKAARARILLATDVAARGLNLHADWTVQYDPPCEIADYIHRAGRVARAGQFGQSLLFLLPSEKSLLPILQIRQQQEQTPKQQHLAAAAAATARDIPALSLASTLQQAAKLCPDLTHRGMQRNGMLSRAAAAARTDATDETGNPKTHRRGEAFCSELQYRLEECVLEQSKISKLDNKTDSHKTNSSKQKKAPKVGGALTLVDMARAAFLSHMRAYPTKEKLVRHIFSARALHLGHIAKSFALREPPKALVKNSRKVVLVDPSKRPKRNAALAFGAKANNDQQQGDDDARKSGNAAQKRAMLMANAAKLQMGGIDGF